MFKTLKKDVLRALFLLTVGLILGYLCFKSVVYFDTLPSAPNYSIGTGTGAFFWFLSLFLGIGALISLVLGATISLKTLDIFK